ncbi:AAA family ATPase [Psychroflexus gondwanensis]|nr:AAA family ATPase [Psychroflexus gondwanensis]
MPDYDKKKLESKIKNRFGTGKALILRGPRQVGKTTLFNKVLAEEEYLFLNVDDPAVRRLVLNPKLDQLKNTIGNLKIVFIDEAQRIDNTRLALKLITDQLKSVQLYPIFWP